MAEPVKSTVVEPIKLTRAWAYIAGHGRSKRSQAWSCDTTMCICTPKEHGRGLTVQTRPNSKFMSHTGKNWGTRACSMAVCPKIYR
ncbi:hypothetical protein GOBAR_AA01161 [Gossypium barbadense]|uniref:Uncharacterized protein n=1 Tax=Gossypium barbadense TaxID=3634 RepID=A0A2P5YUZ0_GOSBA|nr:hypothetical protein GOBAR_AA01161 [Gossypium barbadense]